MLWDFELIMMKLVEKDTEVTEIFQKSEKLTFQPFNSKFEGRMFNACRT